MLWSIFFRCLFIAVRYSCILRFSCQMRQFFFFLLFLFLAFALFTCVQVMYMLKTEMCRQCCVSQIVVAFIFAKTKLENTSIACNCIRWPNLVKYVNEPNPISIYNCAIYTKVEHAYSVCQTKNTQK